MLSQIRPALVLITLLTLMTGLLYPLAITGIAQIVMPYQANGSLVGTAKIVGSTLIGQNFTSDKYFHGRPSATSAADPSDSTKTVDAPYNAANSSGSNLGPTSQKLQDRIKTDVELRHSQDSAKDSAKTPIAADAVTTSASGLDPDISPANAQAQAEGVAKARNMSAEKLQALIEQNTSHPVLGIIGEERVNVLILNMALDAI